MHSTEHTRKRAHNSFFKTFSTIKSYLEYYYYIILENITPSKYSNITSNMQKSSQKLIFSTYICALFRTITFKKSKTIDTISS